MAESSLFSSESVAEGHPDKIADQISDAILDAVMTQDPMARVACETFVNTGLVLIGGEITTSAWVDIEATARQVVKDIGYTSSDMGFDWESCAVLTAIGKQSLDIALGVDQTDEKAVGAGDQGIMFGYACRETESLMPAPIMYAHQLMQQRAQLRYSGQYPWLRPDAKCQVTLVYNDQNTPVGLDTVVLSTQHEPTIRHADLVEAMIEAVIKPVFPESWLSQDTRYFINPTGRFVIGGPLGDCGMTGRKIIVDTYGSKAHHGGGAFSGKDPTKVDRSAAYAARYVAKNIVAAGLAQLCEIQLAYAIGIPEPVSIHVNCFGTEQIPCSKLAAIIPEVFDLTPQGIIQTLQLQRPIYRPTSVYGHFGRTEATFTWERIDKFDALQKLA